MSLPVGLQVEFDNEHKHGEHSTQAGQDISNIFRISVFSISLYYGNIVAKAIKYFRIVKILFLKFIHSSLTNLPSVAFFIYII